jgi:hypothetical protein
MFGWCDSELGLLGGLMKRGCGFNRLGMGRSGLRRKVADIWLIVRFAHGVWCCGGDECVCVCKILLLV